MLDFILYCYFALFIFWHLGGDKVLYPIFDKISDDKTWPISQEWDRKLHNWLCEDDLKIEIPKYAYYMGTVHCVNTPIGEIWIGNYPYCFGGLGIRGLQPTRETKEKLFNRLSEYGLTFDETREIFTVNKAQ